MALETSGLPPKNLGPRPWIYQSRDNPLIDLVEKILIVSNSAKLGGTEGDW